MIDRSLFSHLSIRTLIFVCRFPFLIFFLFPFHLYLYFPFPFSYLFLFSFLLSTNGGFSQPKIIIISYHIISNHVFLNNGQKLCAVFLCLEEKEEAISMMKREKGRKGVREVILLLLLFLILF